jgi:glycosyltransferase involved in cell wall biosynthesis
VAVRVGLDVSAVPARPAGAGRYVVELARRLPAAGVELAVAARRDDAARWSQDPSTTVAAVVPVGRVPRLIYERYALGRAEVVRRSSLWHSPHYTMPHTGATPVVVTIHDMTFFTHPEWHERAKVGFFRRAIAFAVAEAAVLVSVSEFTARELRAHFEIDVPIVVAPHGVALERFTPREPASGVELGDLPDTGRPYVLYVGTLEPRKGVDVLLEAFTELAAAEPEIELWLAGQAGWGVGPIAERVRTHPFAARVRRLGYVADEALPTLLRRARAVAYPSRGEGFGLPVLEAMACGAAVVTTSGTVMAEVAGDAATLTPAGDASALAAALLEAVRLDPQARSARSRAARERASVFSWERSIAAHLEAYRLATTR